jgi:hypothetical protein
MLGIVWHYRLLQRTIVDQVDAACQPLRAG